MTAYTETIIKLDNYVFRVMVNSANPLAYMQRDLFYTVGTSAEVFLRSFFFDDSQAQVIENFCQRFVNDANFREVSCNRKAEWAICNDLFLRNCFNPYYQSNPFLEQIGSLVRAYYFFADHTATIIALATYQVISQHDNAIMPHAHQPDPKIVDIITMFNQIEGVQTLASCQGVSDTIRYQGYDVMTLSPHARFAYIWFASIPAPMFDTLQNIFDITSSHNVYPTVQSTGDNDAFLSALWTWLSTNPPS